METELSIGGLRAAYAAGARADEVIRDVYRRISAAGDAGIFISLVPHDRAIAAAEALGPYDPARPLWGVPFAIKDNIDLAGVPTTAACPDFAYVPERSSTAVERLIAAGAVPVGKTNLDQFATGLVGVRTPYPAPRNAIDPTLVPGGSSSGSAVAVALGLVSFALGTDTAGSGRVPAALNNVVGLKPTRGMIPTRGVLPACRSLDCVSIFSGTVADAWAVLEAASGYAADDPWSRAVPTGAMALPPRLRLGVPDAASLVIDGPVAADAFAAALALLPAGSGAPKPVDLSPFYAVAALLYEGAWVAERYAAIRDFIETKPASLHPLTRTIISGATGLSAADAFAGQYRLAELARDAEALWNEIDVLVVPSIPGVCTLDAVAADPIGANSRLGTYTNFVNLLDLSAIAVPGPFRTDGRPAGLTLIAPAGRDGMLAGLAARIHAAAGVCVGATGRAVPPAPEAVVAPPPGTIPLAVVGAHLSGMPLNSELAARGATFVTLADTAPEYRLYALPGGPPQRPGLVRVRECGAAIAVEVWALSPAAFGDFVGSIPPPLSIGTLRLADGSSVQGFLCEAVATEGARDVSAFGGWRAYVASAA